MGLILFLLVYVAVASIAAVLILPKAGFVAEFLYYAVAGIAWVPAAGLILKWMYQPRPARN
ncbi:MAG: DUF2842 domain-containing protein [Proteobacteria bacterium]|nr:DUF2842 domain-containing protein [Pseudomonadota bacterium]